MQYAHQSAGVNSACSSNLNAARRASTKGLWLLLAVLVAIVVGAVAWSAYEDTAYAKARGAKNQQACDSCNRVKNNNPPTDYTAVVGGKVYSGGNSYTKANSNEIDTDPTDFAKPLPYGNVYVDASKLNWDNPNGFIIDIKDDRFQWVSISDEPLKDAKNNTSTNDPMGVEGAGPLNAGGKNFRAICYVGPLQSYLANITDKATAPTENVTTTNVITPDEGVPYLYRITYLNAVTLPNGTKGNLVLTMKKVQIETSVTINDKTDKNGKFINSYKLSYKDAQEVTHEYEYTKAFMKIQGENQLSNDTGYNITDAHDNKLNQDFTEVLSAEDAETLRTAINGVIPGTDDDLPDTWGVAKSVRNATGDLLDLDIEVTDAEGNEVEGTISYAAHDMDFESAQTIWGRPLGDEFSEGMTIVSGSQSYALVPDYSKLVEGVKKYYKDSETGANTLATGWAPVGPGQSPLDRVLNIKEQVTGKGYADGVRFASPFLLDFRGANGDFSDAIYSDEQVLTFQGDGPSGNNRTIINSDLTKNSMTNEAKKQIYAKLNETDRLSVEWRKVTPKLAWEKLGNHYWKTYRNDFDNGNNGDPKGASFDSGFAVLLDSKKTSIQWSGSRVMNSNINTTLFDPTLFTYIEQTHGTGGGIYMENYNLSQGCAVTPMEGVVTMGKGSAATVTAVPEDGYRIKEFQIGGAELANPATYTMVYGTDGKITGIKSGDTTTPLSGGKATVDGIEFELNNDGSVDISFTNIQDPRHIHVDFDADYYFYKVWKGGEPTKLNMTAVPYAYIFTDVTLPVPTGEYDEDDKPIYKDVDFSIDGTDYTADDGTKYVLNPNNSLETVEKDAQGNPLVTLPYVLKGNSFVLGDKEYPVTVEFGVNFAAAGSGKVGFTVNGPGEYVTELGPENEISPGNRVWKIRYPASGVESLGWPALPIETEPSAGHNRNHVERNYWFVTEEVTGWSLEGYDNSNAETPGVVSDTYYSDHVWKAASVKDYDAADGVIQGDFLKKNAFMSVFSLDANNTETEKSYGGQITNVQPLVVKGVKNWEDENNRYKNRQAIWLHIDAKINGEVVEDVLPPQKLEVGTAESQTATWGDKKVYATNQENVEVIHDLSAIPLKDESGRRVTYERNDNGSYTATNGITYWLNELVKTDSEGNEIEYTIRETMDAAGEKPVEKDDPAAGLIGYTAEADEVAWDDMDKTGKTEIGEGDDKIEADTYQGELTNKINFTDFTVTKIWKENGANRTHTLEGDAAKLKTAYTLKENGNTWVEIEGTPKLQPEDAEEYAADPESGTLEIKQGKDETEVVFIWHNVPYGVEDEDDEGNPIVRKAEFSIVESTLNGYAAPTYSNGEGGATDKALDKGTITNELTPPEGKPKETYGEKGEVQTTDGKSMFKVTTDKDIDGNKNKIVKVELLDPEGNPVESVEVEGGVYTVDPDGTIKFTPDPDFEGTPPSVTVRGTDSNGMTATTTYTPHVVDTVKRVKRTIVYEYDNGTPVLGEDDKPLIVEQVVEFAGTLNKETGEVYFPTDSKGTMEEVPSDEINGYTVDKEKVGEAVVYPNSNDLFEKVIYSPKNVSATADVTYGLPNQPQKGTPTFTMETPKLPDGSPNEVTIKLIDPETGEPVDSKTVNALDEDGNVVGTYTLNGDGTTTFNPNTDYVGNPKPLELVGTDRFGKTAKTTYTPHIVNPEQKGEATRTIHYRYLTEDGEEVTGDTNQSIALYKHAKSVDPKTGEVLEWGEWEPGTFPAVDNPDDKVDGRVWYTDDSVDELTVTEPGQAPDEYVIYEKIPYTVTYLDGSHGKSDGKGDQKGEDYGSDVTGGNTVTPDHGYEFTGTYTYVIKDKDGNVIGEGTTDDPTSLKVTGNIEFTPVYKRLPHYNINYDPNGGSGSMADDNYSADDPTMPDKDNTFKRKGYHYTGFLAYITDPTTGKETPILDKNGKPKVFTNAQDMYKYFEGMPDGTSIRMEAQWEPDKYTIKYDANGGDGTMDPQYIGGDAGSAVSKPNEFTRDGYTFVGFKAQLPDGSYLTDENGNEIVFSSTKDFFDYLAEHGDGAEVTLIAQWEPVETPDDPEEPGKSSSGGTSSPVKIAQKAGKMLAATDDAAPLAPLAGVALLAVGALAFARRRLA